MNVANETIAGHAPHGDHHPHGGGHSPTHKQYITGFVLAVILTAIPFALVMGHHLSPDMLYVIAICAAAQIVVHVVYFLHVNNSPELHWNRLALLYTVIMIGIILAGSLWIMHNLYNNMLPGVMHYKIWDVSK